MGEKKFSDRNAYLAFYRAQNRDKTRKQSRDWAEQKRRASGVPVRRNDEFSFWARVDRISSPNGCWHWTGGKKPNGYGCISFQSKRWLTHRLAYFLSNKIHPGDMFVCHSCDQPSCCNPSHLFLGSNSDNIIDATKKGRHKCNFKDDRIERVQSGVYPSQKLTVENVNDIKTLLSSGMTHKDIAKIFCVSRPTITCINSGRTWWHV